MHIDTIKISNLLRLELLWLLVADSKDFKLTHFYKLHLTIQSQKYLLFEEVFPFSNMNTFLIIRNTS